MRRFEEAADAVGSHDVMAHLVVRRLEEERLHVVPRHLGDRALRLREDVRVVEVDPRRQSGVSGKIALFARALRA